MKLRFTIAVLILLASLSVSAQRKYMVVKFNGDTSYYDDVAAGGKTINCKNKGGEKIKLEASEVSFYLRPTKMSIYNKGEETRVVDTTEKHVVCKGKIFIVQMENDSVYLAESTPLDPTQDFSADFHIIRKKDNSMVTEIRKYKQAPDELKKYFGGSCAAFDAKLTELKPKFQKAVFPYDEWYTLVNTYNVNCKK